MKTRTRNAGLQQMSPMNIAVVSETYVPAEELKEAYLKLMHGLKPNQVIHTCGSGVTACHNMLAMEIAGLHGSKLYAGSWSEWIADPLRPVTTGKGMSIGCI